MSALVSFTTNPPNGAWVVATVPTATTFTFTVINTPTGANITAAAGTIQARISWKEAQA